MSSTSNIIINVAKKLSETRIEQHYDYSVYTTKWIPGILLKTWKLQQWKLIFKYIYNIYSTVSVATISSERHVSYVKGNIPSFKIEKFDSNFL